MARRVIAEKVSAFSKIEVAERDGWIDLDVEGATFASYHPEQRFTGYSWDALTAACLLKARTPQSVLLLGLGGGTVVRQLRFLLPHVEIVAVELDALLIELARDHMGITDADTAIVHDDAFKYVRKTRRRFDVIIDDLFLCGDDDVYRPEAVAGEWLDVLKRRLTDGGVVVANLITDRGHQDVGDATKAAYRDAFPHTARVVPPLGLNETVVGCSARFVPQTQWRVRLAKSTGQDRAHLDGLLYDVL